MLRHYGIPLAVAAGILGTYIYAGATDNLTPLFAVLAVAPFAFGFYGWMVTK